MFKKFNPNVNGVRLVQPTICNSKPTLCKISPSNMFGHSRMNSKHDGELCVMSSTFNQVFWIQARKFSHWLSGSAWLITKSWVVQTLCTENPLLSRVGDGLWTRVSTGLANVVKITGSIPAPAPASWTVFSGSIVACVVIGKEVNRQTCLTHQLFSLIRFEFWALDEGYGGFFIDCNARVHCGEKGGEVFHRGSRLPISKRIELAVHGFTTVQRALKRKRYRRSIEIVTTGTWSKTWISTTSSRVSAAIPRHLAISWHRLTCWPTQVQWGFLGLNVWYSERLARPKALIGPQFVGLFQVLDRDVES